MSSPVPVDLILHSLAELLAEHPDDCVPGLYAAPVARCVDHRTLAEEWTYTGREQNARWLFCRLSGDDMGVFPDSPHVAADTRVVEVAIAGRLAAHAFGLCVTQDAEDARRAATLLRAAHAVVGLAAADASEPTDAATIAAVEMARAHRELAAVRALLANTEQALADARDQAVKLTAERDEARRDLERVRKAVGDPDRPFKVGDRVRVVDVHGATRLIRETAGQKGVVRDYDGRHCWVDLDSGTWFWYRPSELERVTPAPA